MSQLLTPEAESTLHARKRESNFYKAKELNKFTGEYMVKRTEALEHEETFFVDLQREKCSCRVLDIDHIPCEHALAAFSGDDAELSSLCSKYYLKELWALAYFRTIYPVPCQSTWSIPDEIRAIKVVAPDYKKRNGVPQSVRMEAGGQKVRKKSRRPKDPLPPN